MTDFLKTLLVLTAAGTLCGLLLTALRKLSKGKIPNSFLYLAWIVVVLRFAVPVNGLIPVGSSAPHADTPKPSYTEPYTETQQFQTETEAASVPSAYSHTDAPVQPVQNRPAVHQTSSAESSAAEKKVSIPTALFVVWFCGAAGFLLWNVISYARFASLMRKSLSRPSRHDTDLYDEVYAARKPVLKRSRTASAPLTFGMIHPVLAIPDTEYEDDALKNVFQHEMIHFRRHDILLKWFCLLVFSVHWFNPLVRYFRKEIDRVCELSCDEILLKKMNADEKYRYGETLLTIAEDACAVPSRMITGFSEGKKDLRERLVQIMSFKKKSKAAAAIALVPVLILCGCAAVLGPKADKTPDADFVTVSNVDELLAAIAPNAEIRLAAGTYNLTEAASYGKDDTGDYYHWNNYGFGNQYELCIEDVDHLTLIGDNAEILTVPRSANVLAFRKCDQLTLQGLTVGHTEAAEACEGGVIRLETCQDGVIDSCSLYGCGTVGVWAEGSSNLKVSDTKMHHCSTAGVSLSDSVGLSVDGCSIYDCGKPEKYQSAAGAFCFLNVSDVSVKNCDIHDNYLQTLIQGSAVNTSFEGIRVCDNHISTAFNFDGDVQFRDVSFSGNTVNKWAEEYRTGTVTIDGAEITEANLLKMWGDQMASAGVGTVEADYQPIDRTGAKEVHVKTADEFLSAIASDTTVYIDVPQIDLTSASDYGEGAAEEWLQPEFGDKAYAWVYCYDGYELYIGNVSNFHIVGGEIVTQPRYANVLNYLNCSNVTLDGVHLGHTPEQGVCRGGVVYLENTQDVILEGCDLYGCGILGIMSRNVCDLHVQNTLIHDCSNGAAMLEDTDNAVFLGCDVVNCPNPHFFLTGCENFSWDGKLMDPHSSFNVNDDARNPFEEPSVPIDFNADLQEDEIHDREIAANVVCIVTDAYFKGNQHIISGYIAQDSPLRDADEIKIYDGNPGLVDYYMGDGQLVSCELSYPADLVKNLNFIEGLDDIGDNEPDGTLHRIKVHYWTINPATASTGGFDKNVLKIELIREDGCWRVVRF